MDVTRLNFKELFPQIDQEIKEANYLSIDCEFAGIKQGYLDFFDTPEERYSKKRQHEMVYDIVQFGLSIFKESGKVKDKLNENVDDKVNGIVEDKVNDKVNGKVFGKIDNKANFKEIKCTCYNFYIFKYHATNSILPDHIMNISSSAFEFLAINSFDFNKLFKYGITYTNIDEEHRLKASFERRDQELLINGKMDLQKQKLIHEALLEFNEFLRDQNKMILQLGPYEKKKLNLIKATIAEAEKNRRNSPETNLGLKSNGLNIQIDIYRENQTNLWKLKICKEKTQEEFVFDYNAIADEAVGFSKVIQSIIHHRKPVVGHNVLLDIMHIINQFIAPLPSKFEDFRFITRKLFPLIFDTKLMSMVFEDLNRIKVKSLGDLYDHFNDKFPQLINKIKLTNSKLDDLEETEDKPQFHQAGYDSYITGCCFQAIKFMVESKSKVSIYEDSRFKNKFFNAYSYDVPFISTEDKQNIQTNRNNMFHFKFDCEASEFERELAVFNDYKTNYLDDESCVVAILDQEIKKKLTKLIESNKALKITNYEEFKKQKESCRSMKKIKFQESNESLQQEDVDVKIKSINSKSSIEFSSKSQANSFFGMDNCEMS